jgi:hypothetical protein
VHATREVDLTSALCNRFPDPCAGSFPVGISTTETDGVREEMLRFEEARGRDGVFPRKSSRFNHFLDRPTWLLLALEALFGELAGTILWNPPHLSCSGRHHRVSIRFNANLMRMRCSIQPTTFGRSVSSSAISSICSAASERPGTRLVLTINGKAELVVQDAAAYQALLDRVEAIEGTQQGVADVKAGRTKPVRQVFNRLRRKHGIPR